MMSVGISVGETHCLVACEPTMHVPACELSRASIHTRTHQHAHASTTHRLAYPPPHTHTHTTTTLPFLPAALLSLLRTHTRTHKHTSTRYMGKRVGAPAEDARVDRAGWSGPLIRGVAVADERVHAPVSGEHMELPALAVSVFLFPALSISFIVLGPVPAECMDCRPLHFPLPLPYSLSFRVHGDDI